MYFTTNPNSQNSSIFSLSIHFLGLYTYLYFKCILIYTARDYVFMGGPPLNQAQRVGP